MTDGIIQQVFNKYTLYELNNSNKSLEDIKQELIEKIKQEIEFSDSQGEYVMLSKLIGDNQE